MPGGEHQHRAGQHQEGYGADRAEHVRRPLTRSGMKAPRPGHGNNPAFKLIYYKPQSYVLDNFVTWYTTPAASPGHAAWEYYGYTRREYASVRELEPLMTRALKPDLDRAGLGLRLRYLSGGMSDDARTVDRHIFPERSGYFLGAKMVEAAVNARGLSWAVRASASEITSIASSAAASA